MNRRSAGSVVASIAAFLLLSLTVGPVVAGDEYPSKPVHIIVGAAPGGALDLTTRLIAMKMAEKLGQPVIVDNRPGGDTMIGTRLAKEAPADGYTVLAQSPSFSILPFIKLDPGYDPVKDFTGVGNMISLPMILLVGADQPERNLKDLVARAKTIGLNYSTGGPGTPQQLAAAKFLRAAGIGNATEVKYKGAGPALPDIAAGRVDFGFDAYIGTKGFIDGGKMRPLAATSANRLAPLPNVPTFMESGFNFTHNLWLGLVVRADTPKNAIQRLSEALKYAQESKDLNARFLSEGSDPTFTTPEAWTEYLRREYADMGKLAQEMKFEKQ
jgi:tripartite-type tricarboxylate transporter receptor subunit TctC